MVKRIERSFTVDRAGGKVTISIDVPGLMEIAEGFRADPKAMAALNEWHDVCLTAIKRGDLSSPKPPSSHAYLYQLIHHYDPRFPGTIGNSIISEVRSYLLGDFPKHSSTPARNQIDAEALDHSLLELERQAIASGLAPNIVIRALEARLMDLRRMYDETS